MINKKKDSSTPRVKLPATHSGQIPIVASFGVAVETFGPNEISLLQTYTGVHIYA